VLVVAPYHEDTAHLVTLLENYTDSINITHSATEAMHHALIMPFNLAFIDMTIDDMGGIELTTLLKSNPKTEHIDIILFTNPLPPEAKQDEEYEGYRAGATHYLTKPVEKTHLEQIFCI